MNHLQNPDIDRKRKSLVTLSRPSGTPADPAEKNRKESPGENDGYPMLVRESLAIRSVLHKLESKPSS